MKSPYVKVGRNPYASGPKRIAFTAAQMRADEEFKPQFVGDVGL
jgi:hypothetical protein